MRSASRSSSRATATCRGLPTSRAILLIVMCLVAIGVLVATALLRSRARVAAAITVVAAVGVVGWNLTGELAASAGTNSLARQAGATLGRPFSWVDDATHRAPTLYMGEAGARPEPRMAPRVLEPLDRPRLESRWQRARPRTVGQGRTSYATARSTGRTLPARCRSSTPTGSRISPASTSPARASRHTSTEPAAAADVGARPLDPAEPPAKHLHRHLRGRLERPER